MKTLATLAALLSSVAVCSAQAAAPPAAPTPPSAQDEDLACASVLRLVVTAALLTTGGDPVSALKAYGIFLGRLSVNAPEARASDAEAAFEKLSADQQADALTSCYTRAQEIAAKFDRHG